MKKFQFNILIGKKVIYRTVFTFDEATEKEFLAKILNKPNGYFKQEVEVIIYHNERKYKKAIELWRANGDALSEEFMLDFPDIVISAEIRAHIFDTNLFSGFTDFIDYEFDFLPKGVENKIEHYEIESYTWNCKRIA